VTHRNLGWEIFVLDADAPSIQEVDCSEFGTAPVELNRDLTLNAIIDPIANTLTVELTSDSEGWISMAFTNGLANMIGSEAVIGLPGQPNSLTNPGKYNLNAQQVAGIQLRPDAEQTLINATVTQIDGQTILRFTKLLNEEGEHAIFPFKENTFLYAYGSGNNLAQHPSGQRGGFTLNINQCSVKVNGVIQNAEFISNSTDFQGAPSPDDNRNLWVAHGACASVAWAILVPLAIGTSVVRDVLERWGVLPKGMWFQVHRALNFVAAILTIAAFSLAVRALNLGSGDGVDFEHFSQKTHHKVGLALFIITLFQALNGMFRPHLPKVEEKEQRDEEDTGDAPAPQVVVPEKSAPRKGWEIGHRLIGAALVGLAWWQCQDGYGLFVLRFGGDDDTTTAAFWGVVGGISGIVLLLLVYQKMTKSSSEKGKGELEQTPPVTPQNAQDKTQDKKEEATEEEEAANKKEVEEAEVVGLLAPPDEETVAKPESTE
jgi:hypothetical protein